MKKLLLTFTSLILTGSANLLKAQNNSIILGRPTDVSITASIMFDQNVEYYFQYGTTSSNYTDSTIVFTNSANLPDEPDLQNLIPDTKYFYRVKYRLIGAGAYTASPEYTFHTQRVQGSMFSFTIEADEHLYDLGNPHLYSITLQNEAADNPDFMLTLGDIFGDDHHPSTTTLFKMDSLHNAYRPFLGSICHSVPLYVCLGNHEGENDYYLDSMPPNNIGVFGTLARKKYFPNPSPNNFYSGDTIPEGFGMNLPENYYAWTWGNALFVVLDVYRTECHDSLVPKPTNWNWTLGTTQYNWLANVLQNSTAQYKFVFAHHIRGQGRGGKISAPLFEWGGNQTVGGAYTFPANRPGWAMPIHQLFTTYGVNIFFEGHDHLFAHEVLDSVTYQGVPMAADSTYNSGMQMWGSYYTSASDTLSGSGHLRVTVSPACVMVDFVRAYLPADTNATHHNGEVAFSYSIGNCVTGIVTNNNEQTEIKVYPNPAKNRINVLLPSEIKNYKINLQNMLGQTLLQTQPNVIDVSNIPNGIYFVTIETEKNIFNKKVIINH